MSEKAATSKPVRHRQRPRNTATIIKAAKAAGATSVTFPDGTVVTLMPASAPITEGPTTEVDRWFANNAG